MYSVDFLLMKLILKSSLRLKILMRMTKFGHRKSKKVLVETICFRLGRYQLLTMSGIETYLEDKF